MLVRLRDFADMNRISERTVQLHIKENWEVLEEHVDRRGKQGTWLDEFAVNFLLDRIQLPSKDEVVIPSAREAALLIQIAEANKALAEAERRAGENAEAAGKVKLLEAAREAQTVQVAELNLRVGQLLERAANAEDRASKAVQIARDSFEEEKNKAISDAHAAFEAELQKRDKKNRIMEEYVKACAEYNALPGWRRALTKPPIAPNLQEEQ